MNWPSGASEMARRIGAFDWAATSLGAAALWPGSFRATIDLVLAHGFPMLLLWGPERIALYNDAWRPLLGSRHPAALGTPLYTAWPELRDNHEPLILSACSGKTVTLKDMPWVDLGDPNDRWFDLTASPLRNDVGEIGGVLVTAAEATERLLAQRTWRDSADLYRAFVTASANVVYRMSPDWSEMRQLEGRDFLPDTGAPNTDWIDRHIHPDDQTAVRAAIDRAIASKTAFDLEHRVIRVDGTLGVTRSRAVPMLDDKGEIREWLGTATDVTAATALEAARAKAVAASRQAEARFLLKLTDTLAPLEDPGDITAAASEAIGRHLGVGRSGYGEIGAIDPVITIERDWTDGTMPSITGVHMPEAFGQGIPAGHTLWIVDAPGGIVPGVAALNGARACLAVPLMKADRCVAAFYVQQATPRGWTADDETLLLDVAQRTRAALERARSERALRESEERLKRFGDASQDVLWIRDAETYQWEYLTPAFETIYGLDRAAALRGNNMAGWLELIVPEDREYASQCIQRVKERHLVSFEYRIRRPVDGEIRWMRDTDFPIKDASGKVVRIGGIGHDVTPLKAVEHALAAAELRQRALLEGMPQLVWRAVNDGEWTWVSPQWTSFTGQTEAASQAYGWLDSVHPDDRDGVLEKWKGATARGAFHADYRIFNQQEQRYRWFQTNATPVRGADGAVTEWLGTSTDVNESRAMQARQQVLLAELQHRVRNILAIIRSIMRRSRDGEQSMQDYAQHLEGRVAALARTQVLLTRHVDAHVDLEELISDELMAQTTDDARVVISGPYVDLPPKAAEVLALAIHELATNALKYGAIGQPDGRLRVEWDIEDRGDARWLSIVWTESGVALQPGPPRRTGFGTELITRRVPYELKGEGSLTMTSDGAVCSIAFPLVDRPSILGSSIAADAYGERT